MRALRIGWFGICLLGLMLAEPLLAGPGPMVLWYNTPSADWSEALPIGNGKLAAMIFGGVTNEHIQFNEDTIWSGQPHDYSNPQAAESLAEMRQMIFEERERTFSRRSQ